MSVQFQKGSLKTFDFNRLHNTNSFTKRLISQIESRKLSCFESDRMSFREKLWLKQSIKASIRTFLTKPLENPLQKHRKILEMLEKLSHKLRTFDNILNQALTPKGKKNVKSTFLNSEYRKKSKALVLEYFCIISKLMHAHNSNGGKRVVSHNIPKSILKIQN